MSEFDECLENDEDSVFPGFHMRGRENHILGAFHIFLEYLHQVTAMARELPLCSRAYIDPQACSMVVPLFFLALPLVSK